MYLDDAAWEAAVAGHRVVQLSPLPQSPGPGVLDAGGRIGRSFAPERQQENVSLFGALADHIRALREDRQVVIASWSEGARERLQGLMEDQGVAGRRLIRDLRDVPVGGRAFPDHLGAGAGLYRAGPCGDFGTGCAGRPADRETAKAAQGRKLSAARSIR